MRIWHNPERLTDYQITVDHVVAAVKAHNVEVSAGQFGGVPAARGQRLNAAIVVQNLLKTSEEFGAIPIRNNSDALVVRVRDVAPTELGTESYHIESYIYSDQPASVLAIRQVAGANALQTDTAIRSEKQSPDGGLATKPARTIISACWWPSGRCAAASSLSSACGCRG